MHYLNRNPEFCVIAPTAYLGEYATKSNSHLVLAHLVDTDEVYADFYKNLDHDQHFIIMDNGAFELGESYDPDRLLELGKRCGADVIVLPDYPGQPGFKTIEGAERIIDTVRDAGFGTMFVPQSQVGDLQDWIDTYTWAATNSKIDVIGMSILGMPNAMPHVHKAYARVVLTQVLIERGLFNHGKHHHYLGLNSGPALEIPSLIAMNALDTCDSSGPVWAGITGHRYCVNTDSYMPTSKVAMHVNFDQPMTTNRKTLDDIEYNVDMTLDLFDQFDV